MSTGAPASAMTSASGRPSEALTVTVFCGAHCDPASKLLWKAHEIGCAMGARGWRIVYGGGHLGLMGALGRGVEASGNGELIAVIPDHLAEREQVTFLPMTRVVTTRTVRERKQLMDDYSDCFLALPGGIGTLEELVEIMTLRQVGAHDRRILVLDPEDFWAPLRTQIANMIEASLACDAIWELAEFLPDVDSVIRQLEHVEARRPHV